MTIMGRPKARIIGILVLLALFIGAGGVAWLRSEKSPKYRTAPVERGEIVATISASGTLNAVITVQVGSQISGRIKNLYADFNSRVEKGQLIARIDPDTFEAKVNQAKADVDNARVTVKDAKIKRDSRAALFQEGGISQEERDSAQASYDSAAARVEAALAALRAAQVDLDRSYIYAPVNGVVIARNVDVGQTVAASLQAPTLFLIAEDLTKMQVDTNVDEADIGRVVLNQEATFTVDSYPGQAFRGRVVQIRQAPQVLQNVVTYTTVVAVSNPELKLKPGMTANVRILVARRDNVLLVPNAAFRVRLEGTEGQRAPQAAATGRGGARAGGGSGPAMRGAAPSAQQRIWALQDGKPVERMVRTGLSDGQRTEVLEGLQEGDTVIVGLPAQPRSGSAPSGGPRIRL